MGTDERTERARGRGDRGLPADRALHRRLVTKPAECRAYVRERAGEGLGAGDARSGAELSAEGVARLAQPPRPASRRNLLEQESDQVLVASRWKLERGELGGHPIGLSRPPRTRAALAAPALVGRDEEAGPREPFQPAAGDVAVH